MSPARKGDKAAVTKRGRVLAAALSLATHLLILFALFWVWPDAPRFVEPAAVTLDLIGPPGPAPKAPSPAPAAPAAPAKSLPAKPPPRRAVVKPPPPDVDYLPAQVEVAKKSDTGTTLTEMQLAGATMAGSGSGSGGGGSGGGGGGPCDMAGRVQAALRRDPMVRAAIAGSPGKATLVWNGDWVRDLGEDGRGLAIIREAIMWEVAFAPAACRAQPVRGMVVLSLNGAGGATRLALGGGSWRWSDLLTPHPGAGEASE
jgi:hypothetical protein